MCRLYPYGNKCKYPGCEFDGPETLVQIAKVDEYAVDYEGVVPLVAREELHGNFKKES